MSPRPENGTKTHDEDVVFDEIEKKNTLELRKYEPVWLYIIGLGYLQLSAFYGMYLFVFTAKWTTLLFAFAMAIISLLGVSAGGHRLWSHHSYKATNKLKILLAIFQTVSFQEDIFRWARNHRLHHKYVEDDADPYNPKRGYFYSHCGWLLVKRHPRSLEKGRQLDMSDLLNDPVVMFQRAFYLPLVMVLCFTLPTMVPLLWGESISAAFHINSFRFITVLHIALSINSVAHHHGDKPYDKRFSASDHRVIDTMSLGEGSHNFHHAFPWDYRSVEMNTYVFNLATQFIDLMAYFGWAYDLKSASDKMVDSRVGKNGTPSQRPPKVNLNLNKIVGSIKKLKYTSE